MKTLNETKNLNALRLKARIKKKGELIIKGLPYPINAKLEVIIIKEEPESFYDIVKASESSLDFWNNKIDDAVWNNV